ncbi:MAG TPA: methyl-accepting chemotaxis protein [Noviherbaspirillum sp.]|uniref:methyl-accepting chemotaxis protein n=1 Tax=Noviherbaspirillum sp. TaxID=1926288 RepID=UPI002D54BF8E|nr:methyl-accepting chemotaxis protein [Noviherbaspirillum sp.]HYD94501.1 methyl-accepting chemotaxis protein [Noviherbaspirillum sp.]
MFKNLAIKHKLFTLVTVLLLAMGVLGMTGYVGIYKVGNDMEEVGRVRLPSVNGLLTLSEAQTALKAANLTAAIYENNYSAQKQFAEVIELRRKAWANADAGWRQYEPLPQTDEEAVLWKQFVAEWEAWKRADADIAATIEALARSTSEQAQKELFSRFFAQYDTSVPLFSKSEETLNKIVQLNQEVAEKSVENGVRTVSQAGLVMLVVAIAAVVAAVAVATYVTASITRPIDAAVKVAQTVASGDLTSRIEVTTTEETGQLLKALKDMNDNLVKIVGDVRAGTETIATASSQIAVGNTDLSSRTEEQASSLEETASSMEELTTTVKQNADNARQANALAVSASEVASRGGTVVGEVVATMGAINESSKKIADIITVIDGIAFQTNILALNAAVEAARAGEQGRGFAVVASEVRNLAQRSAAAAKEIKALIVDSVEKVETGGKLVDQAGATMNDIVDSIGRVTDIMAEIQAASQEQSAGIDQINQAISQMDQVTQQNAALVEEAAAASESLQDQAARLARTVSVFKLSAPAASDPAPQPARVPDARFAPAVTRQPVRALERRRLALATQAAGEDWGEF